MRDKPSLLAQAERCRRLAKTETDPAVVRRLIEMAEELETEAGSIETDEPGGSEAKP